MNDFIKDDWLKGNNRQIRFFLPKKKIIVFIFLFLAVSVYLIFYEYFYQKSKKSNTKILKSCNKIFYIFVCPFFESLSHPPTFRSQLRIAIKINDKYEFLNDVRKSNNLQAWEPLPALLLLIIVPLSHGLKIIQMSLWLSIILF